jgi:hypothetical protein
VPNIGLFFSNFLLRDSSVFSRSCSAIEPVRRKAMVNGDGRKVGAGRTSDRLIALLYFERHPNALLVISQ